MAEGRQIDPDGDRDDDEEQDRLNGDKEEAKSARGVKRSSPPPPMDIARNKYEKAQDDQLAAQAELETANDAMQTAAAAVIKATWKTTLGQDYHKSAAKVAIILRDRQWPGSTRLGYQSEINDLVLDRRPPGVTTYLFRYALKQAVAPIEDMMIIECELFKAQPDVAELTSQLYLLYHGVRAPLMNLSATKAFLAYVLHDRPDLIDTLSANCLKRLMLDLLMHLACIVSDLARYQNVHYLPPNSFPHPYRIQEYLLVHIPQLDEPNH